MTARSQRSREPEGWRADVELPRDTALLTAALGLVLSFSPSLLRRRRRDQAAVSLASALLGALLGALVEGVVTRLARRVPGGERAARGVIVTAGVAAATFDVRRAPTPLASGVGTAGRVAAIGALVGGVAPRRRRIGGLGITAAACTLVGGVAVVRGRARGRRPRLAEYPNDGYLPTVSGGAGSAVAREQLDYEGTRFLTGAASATEIAAVVGEPARDPIRVFVGLAHAATPAARADLAIRELERLGAFERSRILVCSAALRGYVNPIAIEAAEMLAHGDVASVVVQYFDRRTWLMPLKVPIATATHRALLERLASRTEPGSPELCVYGESLGAWASQEVFRDDGVDGLDRHRVSRALWVGTPWFSPFVRRIRRGSVPTDERVGFLETHAFLLGAPPDAERLRFLFLWRPTDPVALFSGLSLLWHCPPWLTPTGKARRGIAAEVRWVPGVTFIQVLVDLLRSTNWTSTRPESMAHDYRLEVPLAVELAYGLDASREVVERVGAVVIDRDLVRAERARTAREDLRGAGR